jgi:FSR family fosmidomycin resistance protein-like MFS transporter
MNLPTQRRFWAVGLAHFVNDVFMSVTSVILTFLSGNILPMSLSQIGFIVSAQTLAGALGQPFFGWRADKTGGRWIGPLGLALVIFSFSVAILAAITTQQYWLLVIPFILQGIGSSMTHPVGSLHSAESDETRISSNVTYFFLCGQLGLAIAPALVGFLLSNSSIQAWLSSLVADFGITLNSVQANFAPIFLLVVLALPSIWFMWSGIPAYRAPRKRSEEKEKNESRRTLIMPIAVIAALVLLRALAAQSSVYFIPTLFEEKGWTTAEYGLITSFYSLASAISGVICGNLADRFDRRLIVLWTMLLSTPFFFMLPFVDGFWAYPVAILAGGLSGGTHSVIVVLAQELVPNSRGLASGSMLGFIFASGALGSLVTGLLSDNFGLAMTFQIMGVVGALSGFVALLMPKSKLQLQTV